MKVAMPRFDQEVAPCFEHSATITIFTIKGGKQVNRMDFAVQSCKPLDRVRLLRDQSVDTLICGGVQDVFEDLLESAGIHVISWVSGDVKSLLNRFIHGELVSGSGRLSKKTNGESAADS